MVTNLQAQITQPTSLFCDTCWLPQEQCDTPGYQALHLTQQGFRLHAGSFYLWITHVREYVPKITVMVL